MAEEDKLLNRKLKRERRAREQAEKLLEEKSLALYESNSQLKNVNETLKIILQEKSNSLFRKELEYKSLVENINDIICKTKLDGTIEYVNPIIKIILGYTENEILGTRIYRFLPPYLVNKGKEYFHGKIDNKNCLSYIEVPVLAKAYRIVWLGINLQFYTEHCHSCSKKKCILNNNQSISSNRDCEFKEVIIVARDITEQKRNQKIITRQTRHLEQDRKGQELTSEIALELNSLQSFKKRVKKILKKVGTQTKVCRAFIFEDTPKGDLTSNTFEWCNSGTRSEKQNLQLIRYDDFPSWKQILTSKGHIYSEDILTLPDDLHPILNQLSVKSILIYPLTIKNKPIGFIGFVDTTITRKWNKANIELLRTISGMVSAAFERESMEISIREERDRANKANIAKSEFLANVSHEIRTPMNAILGFSEALHLKLDKPKDREMIKSVVKSGKLLLSLLNDILDFSKIEAGKIELHRSPTNLKNTIQEIVQLFTPNASKKNIYLKYKVKNNFPAALLIDEYRIKQVCFNLIANAIKFTDKGGVNIHLVFSRKSKTTGNIAIRITDTGIGISSTQTKAIFESFKQQYGQANRKYGGTGLGLAISQKLIEIMGGTIRVKSNLGIGSEFIVTIPNIDTSNSNKIPKIDEQVIPILPEFASSKVLIIDDNTDNIRILEEFLPTENIITYTRNKGRDAEIICQEVKFDVMFLDIKLPDINGNELALKLRKLQPKSKIVAYTASEIHHNKFACHFTFDDYLVKPLDIAHLFQVLIKYLPVKTSQKNTSLIIQESLISELPEIIQHLQSHFLPQWDKINGYLVLFEIRNFAEQLFEYANDKQLDLLIHYAKDLKNYIELIDLVNIKKQLNNFPVILNKLNNYN